MAERRLLVEMSPLEYSRFVLLERLISRLQVKNRDTSDAQIVQVIEETIDGVLKKPALPLKKEDAAK